MVGFLTEDGQEEWDPWINSLKVNSRRFGSEESAVRRRPIQAVSCFNRLVEIYTVLNDDARDTSTESDTEIFCQNQAQKVDLWRERLPKSYLSLFSAEPSSLSAQHFMPLPHQRYLHLTYLMVLTKLNLYSHPNCQAFDKPERRPPVDFAKLRCMTLKALQDLHDCGTIQTLPPIFEYAAQLAIDSASMSHGFFGSNECPEPISSYLGAMTKLISSLETPWPVLVSVKESLEVIAYQTTTGSSRRSYTSTAAPSFTDLPGRRSTETRVLNRDLSTALATKDLPIPTRYGGRDRPSMNQPLALPPLGPSPTSTSFSTHGGSLHSRFKRQDVQRGYSEPLVEGTEEITSNSGLPLPGDIPQSFDVEMSELAPEVGSAQQMLPTVEAISIPKDPVLESTLGTSIGDDVDAIFRDLAHLDTTDWTNNREQSLRDFGFPGETTFQAFCNDPERLVSNSVFLHPLAPTGGDF